MSPDYYVTKLQFGSQNIMVNIQKLFQIAKYAPTLICYLRH